MQKRKASRIVVSGEHLKIFSPAGKLVVKAPVKFHVAETVKKRRRPRAKEKVKAIKAPIKEEPYFTEADLKRIADSAGKVRQAMELIYAKDGTNSFPGFARMIIDVVREANEKKLGGQALEDLALKTVASNTGIILARGFIDEARRYGYKGQLREQDIISFLIHIVAFPPGKKK